MAYTRQQILKELTSAEIKTLKDFQAKLPAVYLWYCRHKEEIGELPLTRLKRANNSLTKEICADLALKFKHRSDFQIAEKGAYLKAMREGFLDEICVHMVPKPFIHTNGNVGKPDPKRVDMVGKVFGPWKILELDYEHPKTAKGILYYRAECSNCNKIYSVSGAFARRNSKHGCKSCANKLSAVTRTGVVKTKMSPEESAHQYLYKDLKKSSTKRGHEWGLSKEDVRALVTANCHYCGSTPNNECRPLKGSGMVESHVESAVIVRNGIDRVDSSEGYVPGNVVPCCAQCNIAKASHTPRSFLMWARKLAGHQGWLD